MIIKNKTKNTATNQKKRKIKRKPRNSPNCPVFTFIWVNFLPPHIFGDKKKE
jgi:hypothetical protein